MTMHGEALKIYQRARISAYRATEALLSQVARDTPPSCVAGVVAGIEAALQAHVTANQTDPEADDAADWPPGTPH